MVTNSLGYSFPPIDAAESLVKKLQQGRKDVG
jgi:hypothetical protein